MNRCTGCPSYRRTWKGCPSRFEGVSWSSCHSRSFELLAEALEVEGPVETCRKVQLFEISREVLANRNESVEHIVQIFELGYYNLETGQVVGAGDGMAFGRSVLDVGD